MVQPMSLLIQQEYGKAPYLILVSCLLSLRARDTVTLPICRQLFSSAQTPHQMLAISRSDLEHILRPIGFYRQKAKTLHEVSRDLIARFKGKVPSDEADLLSIKGVGRKTANLVRGMAFDIPAICVDTHVHRLANQLGLVHTKTPEQTEREMATLVPKKYWIEMNHLLVTWGQQVPRKQQIPLLLALLNERHKLQKHR